VLDLTSVVSGPLATMFLADQGAEVIKVEPLGGDITRQSRQSVSASGEFSALFVSTNRGKRSLSIDLKRPEAATIMRKLICRADVLVENFRPGTMERLGLGEPALRAENPRLIYVSISGVGERGPYAKKRVYDPIIQGLSGFADLQADPETRRPRMIRTIVADKTTAIFAAQAVTAALFAREQTGEGQHIRLSMLDTMIAYLWPEAMTQYILTVPARGISQLMRLGWFRPVHCKSLPGQEVRALLTARKLLQTKNHDVEMSLRGVLRGFGLKVGPTTPRSFPGRIRELVADHTTLSTVAEALLAARSTLFEQWQKLEKRLRSLAREDGRVRRLMTAPGVGTIVALTYASAIDDPARFRSSSEGLDPEELGNAPGRSRRYAQGQGRARPQARRGAAPHAGQWYELHC
jgi:CoA transferase family III